jgi:HD-like signal output (HDOD) protein
MKQTASFPAIDHLLHSIADHQLTLPTLPDVAGKLRQMLDDINYSAAEIMGVLASDPSLTAQIIKHANSGSFSDQPKANSVREAVSRLGYRAVHHLASNIIAISHPANDRHPVVAAHLSGFWEHSREVATYCYILSRNLKLLEPDQAMLAGLTHGIGALPLCLHAEEALPDLDHVTLEELMRKFRSTVSAKLLHAWNFSDEIIAAAAGHEDVHRSDDNAQASYTDLVGVGKLLNRNVAKLTDWEKIGPAKKLRLSPEVCSNFNEEFRDEIHATRKMLFAS